MARRIRTYVPQRHSILEEKCSSCHVPASGGGLERIKDQRKTPEGWDMTIVRMMLLHGVQLIVSGRETLDGGDGTALDRSDRNPAGGFRLAVEMDDAGAAESHAAAELGTREFQVIAQHPK